MLRCRFNRTLVCGEQIKVGKGAWNLLKSCQNCEIFLKQHQTQIRTDGKKMTNKELQKYVQDQKAALDKRRKEAMQEKGYKEFYSFDEGETAFVLCPVVPREKNGDFGLQSVFRISVDGKERDYSVSQKSPVFRQLIELMDNMTTEIKLRMTRTGTGKNTRMKILPEKTKKPKKVRSMNPPTNHESWVP